MKSKKKIIIASSAFVSSIVASSILGGVFYAINSHEDKSLKLEVLNSSNSILDKQENVNYEVARDSLFDVNLTPNPIQEQPIEELLPIIPLEPIKEPEPVVEPEPIVEPEPVVEPDEPEPPKEPDPKPEKPDPEPEKPEPEPEPTPPEPEPDPVDPPKEEPTPPEPDPEPIPEPPKPEPTPPEPIPEPPKPQPTPPAPKPIEQPKQSDPRTEKPPKVSFNGRELGEDEEIIIIAGVATVGKVAKQPPRVIQRSDVEREIANKTPYINNSVSEILSVEITDEVVNANLAIGKKGLRNWAFKPLVEEMIDYIDNPPNNEKDWFETYATSTENKKYNYDRLIEKYIQLIESGKIYNYLSSEGQAKYNDIMKIEGYYTRNIQLIRYLDLSKLTEQSAWIKEQLSKGYTIGEDNVYINANGEISSYSASPPDKHNGTTSRMIRDNLTKRVFGYNSWHWRAPGQVDEGIYPGWTKTDVTSDYSSYGVSKADGIQISKLTRDEPLNDGSLNEGTVVTIDAANQSGYRKTLKLIQDLKANGVNITSYRIRNMGKTDSNQGFIEILRALPDNLPQLELFFVSQNTSSLIALENKTIKELGIYTTNTAGKSLLEEYNINPWALKNTAWINRNDYNNSFDFNRNEPITSSILFNTLSFENSDYLENSSDPFRRINDGLRMAYYVRNNEPFFQGQMGPGLKPDHDEGGNSYPTGLDLSRAPKLKSLKGMIFYDEYKPSNKRRYLRRLVLFNNAPNFEIDVDELNNAQFDSVMDFSNPFEKSKILFSNGSQTTGLKITNKKNLDLNSTGARNLEILYDLGKLKKTAAVEDLNSPIASRLKQLGVNVEQDHGDRVYN